MIYHRNCRGAHVGGERGRLGQTPAQSPRLGVSMTASAAETASSGLTLTAVRVCNVRTIADVTLPLAGLQILIGENGAGKSTLLEVLEILRIAGQSSQFLTEVQKYHGYRSLLRRGEVGLSLAVHACAGDSVYFYELSLGDVDGAAAVVGELLTVTSPTGSNVTVFERDQTSARVADTNWVLQPAGTFSPSVLVLKAWGDRPPHAAIGAVADALARIQVHLPMHTLPAWAGRRRTLEDPVRQPTMAASAETLDLLGTNLVNAWHAINARAATREEALRRVRLGLGADVAEVVTEADGEFGRLRMLIAGPNSQTPLAWLSAGQISYLGFVALSMLCEGASMVAFDEVETHLHPALLMRVLDLFRGIAVGRPVLLVTHSDALLDGLGEEAAAAAVLIELGEGHQSSLRFPDKVYLDQFLDSFNGLGDMLARGYTGDALSESARRR